MRTAQAFGQQKTLSDAYDEFLDASYVNDLKTAVVRGALMGVFFFVLYCGQSKLASNVSQACPISYCSACVCFRIRPGLLLRHDPVARWP